MKKLALLLLLCPAAFAQNSHKIPIYVDCTCSSKVAMNYATSLRDTIADSPRYMLSTEPLKNDKGGSSPQWILRIVAVTIGDQDSIAISVAFTFGDTFITNLVQTCGINKVSECAKTTLSSADEDITQIIKGE
jgi:hypothetical protein